MALKNNNSSSDNVQENKSRNSNYSSHCDQIDTPSSNEATVSRNSRKKFAGVTKRNSGKYGVKIHDRLRKKDVWLGTFDTAEEASKVYLDKKKELEQELQGCTRRIIKDAKRTSKFVGVSLRDSGKFAAHIRDPIRKKKLYLGAFESEEEAAEVYLAKKAELEEEVKGTGIKWIPKRECRTKSMCSEITKNVDQIIEENSSDRGLEDNQESYKENNNSDSCNGESVSNNDSPNMGNQESSIQVDNSDSSHKDSASVEARVSEEDSPIHKKRESAEEELSVVDLGAQSLDNTGVQILLRTKSGTPVMDSNGFLLGNWSWIDDLTLPISI